MIYFIRHGQSQANADGIIAGTRYPTLLTAKGIEETKTAADHLLAKGITINTIIASPLERTQATAQIIATRLGLGQAHLQTDPDLREYDMGVLSGQPMEGVTPEQRVTAAGAEDPTAFEKRIMGCLERAKHLPGNTLLVSHAGVGRMIKTIQLGEDPRKVFTIRGYPNAKVVALG